MLDQSKHVLLQDYGADASLVFGLEWEALVGNKLEAQSLKRAAELKASHCVKASRFSPSAGFVSLGGQAPKKNKLYSAASIFAQNNSQGTYYERRALSDEDIWVVAVQDGIVISGTDVLVSSAEEAEGVIAELKERYPHILEIDPSEDIDFSFYLNDRSQLHPVRSLFESIPTPLKVMGAFVLALMVLDTGWGQYKAYELKKQRAREALMTVDVEALWHKTLDDWQKTVRLGGTEALTSITDKLLDLPLNLGGWVLLGVACDSVPAGWQCTAQYTRGNAGTNASFKRTAPPDWSISWNGLQGAIAKWSVKYQAPSLNRMELPTIESVGLNYISALQRVLPAFERYTLSPAQKVSIPEPTAINGAGQEETYPNPGGSPTLSVPSYETFELDAPLRSLSVLPLAKNFGIDSVGFTYSEGGAHTLTKSVFTAKVKGRLYVK